MADNSSGFIDSEDAQEEQSPTPVKQKSSAEIEKEIEKKLKKNDSYPELKTDIQSWVEACTKEKGKQ